MPIVSPAFMVSISIKGDCYMNFNLMVISLLESSRTTCFKGLFLRAQGQWNLTSRTQIMENHHKYMQKTILELVLGAGLGLIILSTTQVSAQPLTMDTPTGNLTGEIDISNHFLPMELQLLVPRVQQIRT